MNKAAIYSRVDPTDRTAMPAHKAAAEDLCRSRDWQFVHYSDSGSGTRPPLQFAHQSQLIRPGLTRLINEVEAGRIDAIIPSSDDAMGTRAEVLDRLESYLHEKGFTRQTCPGAITHYYQRSE